MRVIAGSAGGVRLAMDRVKAAIFSSLGDAIIGARVLDLFAGSGALGIEALSRGASFAIFVEDDRQSAEAIEGNLVKTNLKGHVRQQDVFDFLRQSSSTETFQIIFADPPYEKNHGSESHIDQLLSNKSLLQLLEPSGLFVLEKRPGKPLRDTK